MDFRKNYVKFADPAFDGEPVAVKEFGENDPFTDDDDFVGNEQGENDSVDDTNANWDGGDDSEWDDSEDNDEDGRRKNPAADILHVMAQFFFAAPLWSLGQNAIQFRKSQPFFSR